MQEFSKLQILWRGAFGPLFLIEFLSSPLVLSCLTTAVVIFFCLAETAGMP